MVGGFDQGAGFGFGMEFTTFKGGDLKGASNSMRGRWDPPASRAGDLGVRLGTNKTNAEIWFNYTRRTRDNFFDFGSLTSEDPKRTSGSNGAAITGCSLTNSRRAW